MNWNPQPSVHRQNQLDRAKRRQVIQGFESQQAVARATFAGIRAQKVAGEVNLVAKLVYARLVKSV